MALMLSLRDLFSAPESTLAEVSGRGGFRLAAKGEKTYH
jgi:hypothetical protein